MLKLFIKKNISSLDILSYALNKDIKESDLEYNEYGKPYLKNSNIKFNISNKDNITVCVISNNNIGIDIERIDIRNNLINKICKKSEKVNSQEEFTLLWSKKESYLKYLGIGLSYGMKNVDTSKHKYIIRKYNNYYITICLE